MDIGEHCTLGSCAILTFLPITCPYCRALFCQSHFLPLQHSCQAPGAADADRTLSDTEILKRVQRANQRRRDVQQGAGAGAAATPSSLLTTSASAVPDELGRQAHAASANDDADQLPNRLPCQMKGCKRFSLQMDAPNQSAISSSTAGAQPNVRTVDGRHEPRTFTHTAPRCDRCRGFFCMPWVSNGALRARRT